MHRDISVGNLYLYNDRGLIGDLEYAKHRNAEAEREVRIVSTLLRLLAIIFLSLIDLGNARFHGC